MEKRLTESIEELEKIMLDLKNNFITSLAMLLLSGENKEYLKNGEVNMCEIKKPDPEKLKYDVSVAMKIQCMYDMKRSRYKEDCYFYHEERDMCATIPACSYHAQLGYCPCQDCKKYFPKREVYGMIKKIVDERGK